MVVDFQLRSWAATPKEVFGISDSSGFKGSGRHEL